MTESSRNFGEFMKLREEASKSFVNGDFKLLNNVSTHNSPATIFDPRGNCVEGAENVNSANEKSANLFKPGSEDRFEVMHKAADENMAYWVGIQRSIVHMHGKNEGIPMNFRVTEIFRRENGVWQLIHRHADPLASENSA